jgi:hypothetical protein
MDQDEMQFDNMNSKVQQKSIEWRWFLASTKPDKNHRRQAKCKQCDKVLVGRLESMRKHLLQDCNEISAAERTSYIMEIKSLNLESGDGGQTPDSQQQPNDILTVSRKRPYSDSIFQHFSTSVSGPRKKAVDKKLLEAMIVGNVPQLRGMSPVPRVRFIARPRSTIASHNFWSYLAGHVRSPF